MSKLPTLAGLALSTLLISSAAAAQVNVYVDAQNGSNFNTGNQTSPWKTVDFALNGPHAPLPQGSTVYLIGTNAVKYDATSGEAFPWTLYGNINLEAGPNGSGIDRIVDPGSSHAIEWVPTLDTDDSAVVGLTISGPTCPLGIKVSASGGTIMMPSIELCDINLSQSGADGILIEGGAGDILGPQLLSNQINVPDEGVLTYLTNVGFCGFDFAYNNITSGQIGIYINGASGQGESYVRNNDILSGHEGYYENAHNGVIRVENNTLTRNGGASSTGLRWYNSSWQQGSTCLNNIVQGYGNGAHLEYTDDVLLAYNQFDGNSYGVVLSHSVDRVEISHNSFVGGTGIYSNNPSDGVGCVIDSNSFQTSGDGVYIYATYYPGVTVIDNDFVGGSNAVDLRLPDGNVVTGNSIADTGHTGIYLSGCTDNVIAANTILRAGLDGIYDDAMTGGNISSNIIVDSAADGLRFTPAATANPTMVVQNTFFHNTGYGLNSNLAPTTPAYVGNNIFWNNNGVGNDFFGLAVGQYYSNIIEIGGGPGNGNSNTNPGLNLNTYHLNAGSVCIEAGDPNWVAYNRDVDGQPRVVDSDWNRQPLPEIGADEISETSLDLQGPFAPGETIIATVGSVASGVVGIYASTDPFLEPLSSGVFYHPQYGTVILDLSKQYGNGAVTGGVVGGSGTVDLFLPLPNTTTIVGLRVGLQAIVTTTNNAGQLSNAVDFRIREL